ncbi:MAG: hypothetical protein E7264_07000 [Lachnospiraceae bacterium]|nr:hypothetical protein [Lachnospiraceae bacterium]
MANIEINIKKVKNESEAYKKYAKRIESLNDDIKKIRNKISLGDATNQIQNSLDTIGKNLEDQSESLKKTSDTLESVIREYVITETKIKLEYIKEWVGEFIPEYVPDDVITGAMTFLSTIPYSEIADDVSEHREDNNDAWQEYLDNHSDIYIEDQSAMSSMLFGTFSANQNSCGVIATYNALQDLTDGNSPAGMPELIEHYENGGATLFGYLGTSTESIVDYFEDNGYTTEQITGDDITSENLQNMADEYETYIMMSYNDESSIWNNIHYMSITHEDGGYVVHNGNDTTPYPSLEEAIYAYNNGKSEPITVVGIK